MSSTITFQASMELRKALEAEAESDGRTLSSHIRRILEINALRNRSGKTLMSKSGRNPKPNGSRR